jgi:hypothetical protein
MSLGEYLAVLWPAVWPSKDDFPGYHDVGAGTGSRASRPGVWSDDQLQNFRNRFDVETTQTDNFQKALGLALRQSQCAARIASCTTIPLLPDLHHYALQGGRMAWQLQSRLSTLPGVLAGPILRQVTSTSVSVWFAMQYNAEVQVTIYDLTTAHDSTDSLGGASAKGSQIGKNLYFVLVTVPISRGPLVENRIYGYDAHFSWINNPKANTTQPLLDATGLVVADLCYGSYAKPTFCLPPADINKLRIFHGSCRKPHGQNKDALSLLDNIINTNASTPYNRPHQLLLTGDQIYADDVADVLLLLLTDAGEELLGWTETLPFPKQVDGPYTARQLPSYKRYPILYAMGFTSDDLKSHLLSLGEYLAMYLFVWSNTLWPSSTDFPDYSDVETWLLQYVPAANATEVKKDLMEKYRDINHERSHVLLFQSTIRQVRKILANIPTYMICDDHEVTDDWNMTRWFCDQIYSTDAGVRTVQNALVAFAICQAWGNQPDRFAPSTPGAELLDLFATINSASNPDAVSSDYEQYSPQIQVILGIHDSTTIKSKGRVFHDGASTLDNNKVYTNATSLRYDFRIEGDGHLILVTDTRTWRAYPGSKAFTHADFLGTSLPDSELSHQVYLADKPLGGRVLIVVLTTNAPEIASFRFAADHATMVDAGKHLGAYLASTPLVGKDLVHDPDLNPYSSGAGRTIYALDLFDGWEFPSDALDRLIVQIDTLLKVQGLSQQAVILSGDVHSAFASRITYWVENQRFGDPAGAHTTSQMVIAQLVASAFKNEKQDIRGQHSDGYTYSPQWYLKLAVPSFVPEGYAGWNRTSNHTKQLGPAHDIQEKPDYRYRLDYLVTSETGQNAPPPKVIAASNDPAKALANYNAAAAAQRATTKTGSPNQQIIGHNNIAELSFVWQPNLKRAYHTLYWIMKNPDEDGNYTYDASNDVYVNYWSRYDVSLNLDDPAYKKIYAANEVHA